MKIKKLTAYLLMSGMIFRNDEQRFVYDQSTGCRNNRRNRG